METYKEAEICAALFQKHAAEIDGIIITLPNFGEERGLADAVRLANLNVPVLIQATPDDTGKMAITLTAATASAARCRSATTSRSTASSIR